MNASVALSGDAALSRFQSGIQFNHWFSLCSIDASLSIRSIDVPITGNVDNDMALKLIAINKLRLSDV